MNAFFRDGAPRRRKRPSRPLKMRIQFDRPAAKSEKSIEDEQTKESTTAPPPYDVAGGSQDVRLSGESSTTAAAVRQQQSTTVVKRKEVPSHIIDYIQAKRSLLNDFDKTDELQAESHFSKYLNAHDIRKKKRLLRRAFRQCYKEANKNLDKSKIMMQQIAQKSFVVLLNENQVKSSPNDEEKLPTYPYKTIIGKRILKLFGRRYFEEDNKILFPLSDTTNINGNDWSSEDEIIIDEEKPKVDLTNNQIVTEAELIICKVINPNDNIYTNDIVKDLGAYFSNDEFLLKFDRQWETTQSKLVGELIVKLFEEFNNTKRNMAYLSGSLICVFQEVVKTCPPSDINEHFILFIDCIRKYAKFYDSSFWRIWFVPKLFFNWCFFLACVFLKDVKLIAALGDKTIFLDAMLYFKKIKHCKYVFVNSECKRSQLVKGIFELTEKSNIFDIDNLSSSSVKNLSKPDINPITSEPKIIKPKLGNCVETTSQTKKSKNIEEACPVDLKTSHSVIGTLELTKNNNLLEIENLPSSQKALLKTDINPTASETKNKKSKLDNHCVETISNAKKRKNIEEICPVDLKTSRSVNGYLKLTESNNPLDIENLPPSQKMPSIIDITTSTNELNSKKPKVVNRYVENEAKKFKNIKEAGPVDLKTSQSMSGILEITERNNLLDIQNMSSSQKNPSISDINVNTSELNSKKRKLSNNFVETTSEPKKCKNIEEVCPVHLEIPHSVNDNLEQTESNYLLDLEKFTFTNKSVSISVIKNNPSKQKITSKAEKGKNVEEKCPVPSRSYIAVRSEFSIANSFKYINGCPTVDQNPNELQPLNSNVNIVNNIIQNVESQHINADNSNRVPITACNENYRVNSFGDTQNAYFTVGNNPEKFNIPCTLPSPNYVQNQPSIVVNNLNSVFQMNHLLSTSNSCSKKQHSLTKNTRPSKTNNSSNIITPTQSNVRNTRPINAINSQPLSTVNSQNSVSMNNQYSPAMYNQYSPIMNTQPSNAWNIPPSFPMNTTQYSNGMNTLPTNTINSQPTSTIYTQPSSAINSQNSVGMSTQYLATTNALLNQPVTNGLQNSISNNSSNYNITHQYNTFNNVRNASNVNESPYYKHITSSLPNTHFSNHNSTSLSQQSCPKNLLPGCSNPQCTDQFCKNSRQRLNKSTTLNSIPKNQNQFTYPASYNIQPPSNTNQPLVNSSRNVPGRTLLENYGNNQFSNNENSIQSSVIVQQSSETTKAKSFQLPDHNSLVSPDLPDAQSPSMPIQSISSNIMCMAGNCNKNSANYYCEYCFVARYCSIECQKYDWFLHTIKCNKS